MLDLKSNATTTFDVSRVRWFLDEARDHNSMKRAVGSIGVNGDRWAGEEVGKASAWHRCEKDAEVAGLCLLAYWEQSEALNELLTDLTFQMQMLGTGSHDYSEKLKLIDMDAENAM